MLARALGWIDPATRSIIPPLYPSTTFERNRDLSFDQGREYLRDQSPAFLQAEALLAALEGGHECLLFASGMAAASAVFQALGTGDHVVAPAISYHGVRAWLKEIGSAYGIATSFVPNGDVGAIERAVRPGETRIVWLETPANPQWIVTDIAAAAAVAHRAGALLGVDSTAATPILTRPIALGADLVMHSATKYLNGHSDVLAGALIAAAPSAFWQRVRFVRQKGGAVPGPFEAWLLLRGMRTLHLRVAQCSANALAIARHFHGHPKLVGVLYPGLPDHPGHAVAARQMRGGFGGMMALRVKGGREAAVALAAATRIFFRATSLGGVESLIEHRASVEGPDTTTPDDLLRLSIGIEDVDDLIADLEQALDAL